MRFFFFSENEAENVVISSRSRRTLPKTAVEVIGGFVSVMREELNLNEIQWKHLEKWEPRKHLRGVEVLRWVWLVQGRGHGGLEEWVVQRCVSGGSRG
jgi:hypothetical protein